MISRHLQNAYSSFVLVNTAAATTKTCYLYETPSATAQPGVEKRRNTENVTRANCAAKASNSDALRKPASVDKVKYSHETCSGDQHNLHKHRCTKRCREDFQCVCKQSQMRASNTS